MRAGLLFAALIACTSCSVIEQPSGLIPRWTTAWKQVVTSDDRQRLADWRTSFVAALDAARKAGHTADIAREGALLEPDAALGPPAIPNGMFRCRVIKVGAKADSGGAAYSVFPSFLCRVKAERGLQRFNKYGGKQRYVGLIFPGDAVNQVFLGMLVLGDENRALQYGQDELRDVAGYVQRIGPNRWRIIMPKPHLLSVFELWELVPAASPPRCLPPVPARVGLGLGGGRMGSMPVRKRLPPHRAASGAPTLGPSLQGREARRSRLLCKV
jgi:hypothetical protein